jgi:4-hydroxybenzoyl-CoA reductase subunit beta
MEYLPEFRVHRPATVEEAVKLRAAEPDSFYLAGGTDLVVNIRRGIERPKALVDLGAVADLHQITAGNDGLTVGAAVPLAELAVHPAVRESYPAAAQAAGAVAGPTHRTYGTVGGNLCLDTRCLFYNQSEWWRSSNDYCLKERGSVCHVAPGGNFCFAAFSGDIAPALLVLGAEVTLVAPQGRRRIPLNNLYNDDGRAHLMLKPGELLATIHLPKPQAGLHSAYEKARIRGSIDFPLAGVAVALSLKDGKVSALRAAITGVNPRPMIVAGTDALLGKALDDAALDRLRDLVRAEAKPMRTTTAKPWYRRRVIGNLARRLAVGLATP